MEALLVARLAEQSAAGDNIRVVVRMRPPNERELAQARAAHASARRGRARLTRRRPQGYVKECVAAQPATGAIAVAGKAFTFDAVCDDTMGQARAPRRATACRRPDPFALLSRQPPAPRGRALSRAFLRRARG